MNLNKSNRYMPLWLALCVILGILIGTFYANHFSGNRLNIINSGSNRLNNLLHVIDDQYVDSVNMKHIAEIAKRLGISKPSVNRAVGTLKAKGYVTHEPYGAVLLTDKGRELGEYSGNRNRMVKRFLINVLKMNDADAEKEAVCIARSISFVTAEKMRSYMEA